MANKWFFPIQHEVRNLLHEEYDEVKCSFQDVNNEAVYEQFNGINKTDGRTEVIQVVMHKSGAVQIFKGPKLYSFSIT